ncbi:MAG: hypothetical protein WCG31_02510 [Deltaproteobacteria bacterium]
MKFREILRRCVFGTIGYIGSRDDLAKVEWQIRRNLPILGEFRQILVATNFVRGGDPGLAFANRAIWRSFFPDSIVLDSKRNRGHAFGAADLDNLLFDHCKANGIEWLCKGTNDIILEPPVLEIEVRAADFYFLNAIDFSAMKKYEFDFEAILSRLFFPQTNFYVINVAKTDYLVGKRFLDSSHAIVKGIPRFDGRIWEHIPNWSNENLLRKCVQRNCLTRCHLMDETLFLRVLQVVNEYAIDDCSHKNLEINGICHYHGITEPRDGAPKGIIHV